MRLMAFLFIILLGIPSLFVYGNDISFWLKNDTIEEIQQTLDSEDVQVVTALGDNSKEKLRLLQSPNLNADGLIALCTNPDPLNIDNSQIQIIFAEAIERTELTSEQQVQIASIDEFVYSKGLLLKTDLSQEGLVEVCKNPGNIILDHQLISLFAQAMERAELTPEQEVEIAELEKETYNLALLAKSHISPEALVSVCENYGNMNLEYVGYREIYANAFERTDLSPKQQVKIAELDKTLYTIALLNKTDLSPEGLIAVCENPGDINLRSEAGYKLVRSAIERTALSRSEQVEIAKLL